MKASNLVWSGLLHPRSGSSQLRRSSGVGRLALRRPTAVSMVARDDMEPRRTRSEVNLIQSGPAPPKEDEEDNEDHVPDLKSQALTEQGMVAKEELDEEGQEETESFGGGMGNGSKFTNGGKGGRGNGGQWGGNHSEKQQFHDWYKEILRREPRNPLFLRNYGKFLYEVEGDVKGAQELYGRAILVNPGDGEVLMLYGMLVWENYREEEEAMAYLQRAVEVSPNDSVVLAAYARFLWEAGEEEDEDQTTEFMTK